MKRLSALLLLTCLLPMLSGCWDKIEIEDNTFAVLLGIDIADKQDIIVTVAFPLTQTQGGSSNEGMDNGSGNYTVMSVKAETVVEALNMFNTKLSGPLALYSIKTLVISRELAEHDMLRKVFSSWRYEEIRSTTNVLISECKASEFIAARVENSLIDLVRQEELLLEQASRGAHYKPSPLLELLDSLKSNSGDGIAMLGGIVQGGGEDGEIKKEVQEGYLPGDLPVNAENETAITGLAVFNGDHMVGVLDSSEAQTFSLLTSSNATVVLTLDDPLDSECSIVVRILPRSVKICSAVDNGKPVFDINVRLKCTVESIQSDVDYEQTQNYNTLTKRVQELCESDMKELVEKIQKKYDADILGLGDKLAYHFTTIQAWEDFGWQEKCKDAEITLNVELKIERTGIMLP